MEAQSTNLGGSLVLRGVLAILFGAAAVFWPGETLLTLVYLFSTFVLINGVIDLVFGISRIGGAASAFVNRWLIVILGALQIGVGIYLLRHPRLSFTTLIILIGFTLIVRGLIEAVEGLFEDNSAMYKTIMVLSGLLAIIAGVIMLFQPVAAGVAFVWVLGVYALITGPMMIALAMDVHRLETAGVKRR